MHFAQLTLLYSLLIVSVGDQASEQSSSAETTVVEPAKETEANIVLQSIDGGKTWQDISRSLPEIEERMGFYAGASELYLSTKGVMYRSKSNLNTPVWEKENVIDPQSTIAFNQSGVLAYSYDGNIYKKKSSSDPDSKQEWLPVYTRLKSTKLERHEVATIFEASDGTIFKSTGKSFARSTDNAQTWTLIQKVWVGDIVEADGVLVAAGQNGIMRSTDKGETWEWVINEGGVGIAVERIDGGFAAIAYNTQTKSRRIHISMDGGVNWKAIDGGLPPSANISSIKQLGRDLFVGHPDGILRSSDMGKSWQRVRAGFGNMVEVIKLVSWNSIPAPVEKVYKIYVSGQVLYAVAVAPGC
jgi:photosystem II stability/assembly factor-like uncharacterized protein